MRWGGSIRRYTELIMPRKPAVKQKRQYKILPEVEKCGACGRSQMLHRPDGFAHEFVSTGLKAFGVDASINPQ